MFELMAEREGSVESELAGIYDRMSQTEKDLAGLRSDVTGIKDAVAQLANAVSRQGQELREEVRQIARDHAERSKTPWSVVIGFGSLIFVIIGGAWSVVATDIRSVENRLVKRLDTQAETMQRNEDRINDHALTGHPQSDRLNDQRFDAIAELIRLMREERAGS